MVPVVPVVPVAMVARLLRRRRILRKTKPTKNAAHKLRLLSTVQLRIPTRRAHAWGDAQAAVSLGAVL